MIPPKGIEHLGGCVTKPLNQFDCRKHFLQHQHVNFDFPEATLRMAGGVQQHTVVAAKFHRCANCQVVDSQVW